MGRILVVDDDPDILKLAERVLTSAGHTVLTAEDAMRALDLMNRIEFDMLVSDANMPHFSGFDLVATVRKNSNFAHMSVAMLTGLKERKDVEKAIKAGVDDYIVKPIDPLILVQKISALFEKRPPARYPEINFASLPKESSQATTIATFELVSMSELGMNAYMNFELPLGYVIDVKAEFFDELGSEPPPCKVVKVDRDESNNRWLVSFTYLGARESFLQKVRKWLNTHGATNRNAS